MLAKEESDMSEAKPNVISHNYQISDKEFNLFKNLIYEKAGIDMQPNKRSLVASRLSKRMRSLKITSFYEYYHLAIEKNNVNEIQNLIDYLTTNETYFFREDKHFEFLKDIVSEPDSTSNVKVWSAACSTGEEAYSTSMVLADNFGIHTNWHILGTDINQDVLSKARKGLYPLTEKEKIPRAYLNKYCLKGVRSQSDMMLMEPKIKKHISFEFLNLNADWPGHINDFDVVFLRNVMIYFDLETKKSLVDRIANKIKPGGYLFIGHSETLNQVSSRFKVIRPSICQKIK